jgi:hypothetical protein
MNFDHEPLAVSAETMGPSHSTGRADRMFPVESPMGPTAPRTHARFLMRISALAIAIVQLLDVATTNSALASGGAELNPIMRLSMANLGSLWWLPKAAIALFILAYVFSGVARTPTRRVIALAMIVLAVSAVCVANNIAQLTAAGW